VIYFKGFIFQAKYDKSFSTLPLKITKRRGPAVRRSVSIRRDAGLRASRVE
jgi:hypothetical protein